MKGAPCSREALTLRPPQWQTLTRRLSSQVPETE
jgi:hypothetical protein